MRKLSLILMMLMASTAVSGGTLDGRTVTFTVLTYDDPERPILEAMGRTVKVGNGVEFGLEPEGLVEGFDVVPVQIEISPNRVEGHYSVGSGTFWDSKFNGYVLIFETDCVLFNSVKIDKTATTLPLTLDDISTDRGRLYINVAGMPYGPGQSFALDFKVADCPMS